VDGIPSVVALQIGPTKGAPTLSVPEVLAVAGKGLEGDRFFKKRGVWWSKLGLGKEVTLIEEEALLAVEREHGLALTFAETRRNVLVRGVALNDLVGHELAIGEVVLRGVRLCEPCRHLSELTGKPLVRPLAHRGGLNAVIVTGGLLRVGAPVVPLLRSSPHG
jgi:MOSC domain-containing protein YiiM